ncbi:MAG: hypothetical protein DRR06_14670 [Gammaproteobacteria bacterium]|nr:MAG: hypothetical protein DRR06_14670 [Gammaproteobacteria bacterium]
MTTYLDSRIHGGGLMRCCVQTILEYCGEHVDDEVEDLILDCKYEREGNKQIVLKDGDWHWNEPGVSLDDD